MENCTKWTLNYFVYVQVLRTNQPNGVTSSAVSLPNHVYWAGLVLSKRLTSIVHILSPESSCGHGTKAVIQNHKSINEWRIRMFRPTDMDPRTKGVIRNWQLPFLNQRRGRGGGGGKNDRRKYFMIYLHERMLLTSAGVEHATSWSPVARRIQLSHRGRKKR